MFAVVEDRKQQYRVAAGEKLLIALIDGLEAGSSYEFSQVCLIGGVDSPKVGAPFLDGASVRAKIVRQGVPGPKLVVQKYRRRKNYRRRTGFRARYTEIQIEAIHGA
jgi:large subunit ribosomal protein L21